MFYYFLLLILVLPIVETLGLYWLSGRIGMIGTLAWILATGFVGASLARRQGMRYWKELNEKLDRQEAPSDTITHGLLILLAGFFLILPGLLTDLLGLLLLIPLCRRWVILYASSRFHIYRVKRQHHPSESESAKDPQHYDAKKDVLDV